MSFGRLVPPRQPWCNTCTGHLQVLYLPSCLGARICGPSGDAVNATAVPTSGGVIVVVGSNFGDSSTGLTLLVGEEEMTKAMVPKQYEEMCPPELPVTIPYLGYCILFEVGVSSAMSVAAVLVEV